MDDTHRDKSLIILIKSLFDQIDEVVTLKSQGKSANLSKGILEEMAKILPELNDETREQYYELLAILSASSEPAKKKRDFSDVYVTETAKAKRRMIESLRSDLKIKIAI